MPVCCFALPVSCSSQKKHVPGAKTLDALSTAVHVPAL